MQNLENLRWDTRYPAPLNQIAGQFRDNIWSAIESWMLCLATEDGESAWKRMTKSQLIDSLPALLRGIAKVIENSKHVSDFEADGPIYQAAIEFGRNRRIHNYNVTEMLHEQEVLHDIIWGFCRKNFTTPDFYELEYRINRPLGKLQSIITTGFVSTYAEEIKQAARRDRLTDLLNYESFKDVIGDELRRSRRYRHVFALIMLDVDDFKAFNESFGHAAGDKLIQNISRIIAQAIRNVDIPIRYGSDQFAVILPETSRKQARKVAERLRRAIKLETRHAAQLQNNPKLMLTISAGISAYPKNAETIDELINLADEALFEAKQAGKDLVMCR